MSQPNYIRRDIFPPYVHPRTKCLKKQNQRAKFVLSKKWQAKFDHFFGLNNIFFVENSQSPQYFQLRNKFTLAPSPCPFFFGGMSLLVPIVRTSFVRMEGLLVCVFFLPPYAGLHKSNFFLVSVRQPSSKCGCVWVCVCDCMRTYV